MVVVEEVMVEMAEGDDQEEVVTALALVVKEEGVTEEVTVMMMAMIIMTCLNIKTGKDSYLKTLQSCKAHHNQYGQRI